MHDSTHLAPMITIGLTTYNRPDLLKETINSILSQKYTNFKLLIGNDYPDVPLTFDSLNLFNDSRVEIINYGHNIGEINNLNHLLNEASSEWFTWISDDDVLHSEFLSTLFKAIPNDDSTISAVYCNYSDGTELNDSFFNAMQCDKPIKYSSEKFISEYVSKNLNLIGCYGILRTKYLKINGFPSLGNSFGPYSDTLIPILLSEYGDIIYVNNPLIFLRTHANSLSIRSENIEAYTTAEIEFLPQLIRVCSNKNIDVDHCVYDMTKWFSGCEFGVISRKTSLSHILIIYEYFSYQLKVNYRHINKRYWLPYTIYIIWLIMAYIKRIFLKK